MPTDLRAVRDLMVAAEGIEAAYGPNAYVDYLRKHHRYPSPEEAAAIGKLLGGRVRASDGSMQPARVKRRKSQMTPEAIAELARRHKAGHDMRGVFSLTTGKLVR